MYFDYHTIGSINSSTKPVSLHELAANIATDWMPGTPSALSRGFVDLLANILETKTIKHNDLWTVRPKVGRFEKQWKQVTSWILGVAFCRKVVEMEGYPWWAPVSAFGPTGRRWAPITSNWHPALPRRSCRIIRPTPKLSSLMPDYVLARNNSPSRYEIAFAESKGRKYCLENSVPSLQSWKNQSKNAEFHFRNNKISASQNLVVATRVNPKAMRPATRRIYVRVWNSKSENDGVKFEAFLEVLLMHYFGVCERIGMEANANLLALSTYTVPPRLPLDKRELYAERLVELRKELSEKSNKEITEKKIKGAKNLPVFFSIQRSEFVLGEKKVRIGLSAPAMKLINRLQEGIENSELEHFVEYFQEEISSLRGSAKESPKIIIRKDGVFTELIQI